MTEFKEGDKVTVQGVIERQIDLETEYRKVRLSSGDWLCIQPADLTPRDDDEGEWNYDGNMDPAASWSLRPHHWKARDWKVVDGVLSSRPRKPTRVKVSDLPGTVEVRDGKPQWDSYKEDE